MLGRGWEDHKPITMTHSPGEQGFCKHFPGRVASLLISCLSLVLCGLAGCLTHSVSSLLAGCGWGGGRSHVPSGSFSGCFVILIL